MAAMSYRCLTEFLEELGHAGELVRVEEEVDPAGQVAEIVAHDAASGGAALLFGCVAGHDLPILSNLLATQARIGRALGGVSLDEVSGRIARLFDIASPEGWFERLKGGAQPAVLASVVPRKVKSAACQQIVRLGGDIDLDELPLLQAAPEETGRAIPGVPVFSAEPDSHQPRTARFDLVRVDRGRLAVCWAAHDDHARLLGEYRARQQKMPLAVVIGGDPGFLLAGVAPLPSDSDLCAVTGLLREKALDVVACRSVDLDVPAEAEIVIEGFIDPQEPPLTVGRLCGPTGHLTQPRLAPVMQVTAVTHRANPIYVVMTPGRPPHEACSAARAMHRVFQPLARLAMPELVAYDLPEFGAARHWAAVSIRATYPGQAHRAAHAAWNLPAMMFAKVLVIVDADVDVYDNQQVMAAMAANMRPDRDIILEQGPPDPFDPATPVGVLGQKMAIDATRK
jgi:4-hydroxy-3-polyprenylbenzoate decarboxylase